MKSQLTDFATLPPLISLFPRHSVRDPSGPHSHLHPAVTAMFSLRSDSAAFPLHFVSSSLQYICFSLDCFSFPKCLMEDLARHPARRRRVGGLRRRLSPCELQWFRHQELQDIKLQYFKTVCTARRPRNVETEGKKNPQQA